MKIESIKNTEIVDSLRFDGSYHLAEGNLFLRKIKTMPYKELGKLCEDIFTSGRRKRVYTKKEKGYPYLSNSDVVKINPFDNCNYNSKKYGYDETAFLKEGMIVTGRVGAIGQTAYITSEYEEKKSMGSDNIIRIVCKEKNKQGYIYSFLASKVGTSLIQRLAAGGVQPYISDKMLIDLPIPLLSEQKQKEIHQLIVEASELRVEANKLLEEAVEIFEIELNHQNVETDFQYGTVSNNKLNEFHQRIDAQYQLLWQNINLQKSFIEYKKLNELSSDIYVGGRGKRNYIDKGIPFLSSSEMMMYNPIPSANKISNKTPGIEKMKVQKDDILISRSGTVGNTVIVGDYLNGTAVSEHALRLIINPELISPLYVFAFLRTSIGKISMEASAFGSVIITLNEDLVGNIEIPILPEEKRKTIIEKIQRYIECNDDSVIKENEAISLIEKEIDTWQKS